MVKTHRMTDDIESHTCKCGKDAHYWSQNENGHKPLGRVVYHCQSCRKEARLKADHVLTSEQWLDLRNEILDRE